MLSPTTPSYWLLRFVLGVLMIALAGLGFVARLTRGSDPVGLGTLVVGFWGFWLALSATRPLALMTWGAWRHGVWTRAESETFARASVPRRTYYLLTAVAEVDGPASHAERLAVREVLLTHFGDRLTLDEVRHWEAQPLPIRDRVGLAARIAAGMEPQELDWLFGWCCSVAFADDRFADTEHEVLHEVARGLGLPGGRARLLFHLARAEHLRARDDGAARPVRSLDPRADALAVLGLPPDAAPDAIRKRHRELVRRFHPDRHANLGPVAQREATERFQQIQRAYETLTT